MSSVGGSGALVTVRLAPNWIERGFNATAAGTTDAVLAPIRDGGTVIVGAAISQRHLHVGPHPQLDATV